MNLKLFVIAAIFGLVAVGIGIAGSRQDSASAAGNVVDVSAGVNHSCLVTNDGLVQCWGYNWSGELGIGTSDNDFHPSPEEPVALSGEAVAVEAGLNQSCALLATGNIQCWGEGPLGDGTFERSSTPVDVIGINDRVVEISMEFWHICALTDRNDVYCWGHNYFGQVGESCNATACSMPLEVEAVHGEALSVLAGLTSTCIITRDQAAKCWGANSYGGLGDGSTTDSTGPVDVAGLDEDVTAIEVSHHTCALTVSRAVKCWGFNEVGQLGDGTSGYGEIAFSVSPVTVVGLEDGVTAIATGLLHTCALMVGGGVKCWGGNEEGQIGDGTLTDAITATDVDGLTSGVTSIDAGTGHTCAVVHGGVKCWGLYYGSGPIDVVPAKPTAIPTETVTSTLAPPTGTPIATDASTSTPTHTPTPMDTNTPTPVPATPTPGGPATATPTPVPPTGTLAPVATLQPTDALPPTATPSPVATATPAPEASPPGSAPGLFGDVGCDGTVSVIDAMLILQHSAALLSSLACQDAGDVNGDGRVDPLDATLILQYVAGLIDSL